MATPGHGTEGVTSMQVQPISTLPPRIRRQIDFSGDCWLWTGGTKSSGYGQVYYVLGAKRNWQTHRLVYWLLVGELPEHLHHRCHVPLCVRPDHLQPMAVGEHMSHHHGGRETCSEGHEYTPENTYVRPDGAGRQCRICKAQRMRAKYASLSPAEQVRLHAQTSQRRRERRARQRGVG